jgi:FkbM family methyltransferase
MLQHHPVFSRFKPFHGEVPGGYQLDGFLGTMVRQECVQVICNPRATTVQTPYPKFEEDYFEWIDLLESVVEARGSYAVIELGAGLGRWSVRAVSALRQYNRTLPYRLIAVEAEPVHFEWMRLHFTDNGIDPNKHSLIHAAVSDASGRRQLCIRGPAGGDCDLEPKDWYGQYLTADPDRSAESGSEATYGGFKVTHHESGRRSINVPSVSLASILKNVRRVDLTDIDIQGEELNAIRPAIGELNAKVKRLFIATHKQDLEAGLRELLSGHGWRCQADYSVGSTAETPWGRITFQDGVQSWLNPRLCRPRWSLSSIFSFRR